MIPSLDKIVAIFFSFWMFAHASGHPEWVWKGIAYVQRHALQDSKRSWGCPSIFSRSACGSRNLPRHR